MDKAIFLDRDGVLNYDSPDYVYEVAKFKLYPEVPEVLKQLKEMGYRLIVITNQAGLSRGLYTREHMQACHNRLNIETGGIIDSIYYSPYHPSVTRSLSRKPGTLMFEKARAKFDLDFSNCWMIGDKPTDLEPAEILGIRTIGMQRKRELSATYIVHTIDEILPIIRKNSVQQD